MKRLRTAGDQPSIGLLICRDKDKVVAEYALKDVIKPIGVAQYQLTESIPENLKGSLPSIEDLERELPEGRPSRYERGNGRWLSR